jgi:hypothetical protein
MSGYRWYFFQSLLLLFMLTPHLINDLRIGIRHQRPEVKYELLEFDPELLHRKMSSLLTLPVAATPKGAQSRNPHIPLSGAPVQSLVVGLESGLDLIFSEAEGSSAVLDCSLGDDELSQRGRYSFTTKSFCFTSATCNWTRLQVRHVSHTEP